MIRPRKIDANDRAAAVGSEGLAVELETLTAAAAPVTATATVVDSAEVKKHTPKKEAADGDGIEETRSRRHPDYQELSRLFLRVRMLGEPGIECQIKSVKDDFYYYDGKKYTLLEPGYIKGLIVQFLQNLETTASRVSQSLVNNVLLNLSGLCLLRADAIPPCWIISDDKTEPATKYISTKNGILDLTEIGNGGAVKLISHSPRYFALNSLDYEYDPDRKCPTFDKFLCDALDSEQTRNNIQEFLGLCLIPDTSFHKFLMLVGLGGNGKTTLLNILRKLIGDANVSDVPLSAFAAERTFPLSPIIGKLVNIQPDVDSITMQEEGLFKQVTGGDHIQIERKMRDPISHKPTIRMVISTNNPPTFKDRSRAIWRRLLYVPFAKTAKNVNRDLAEGGFWVNSGELPGILNFALEGLRRLYERGQFIESDEMETAKYQYMLETRHEVRFLVETYEFTGNDGDKIPAPFIYEDYGEYLKENGFQGRLSSIHFGRQVKIAFPGIKNYAFNYDGTKNIRCWIGIRKRIEPLADPFGGEIVS